MAVIDYNGVKKIKMIIPAYGWYAEYDDGKGEACYNKVICFALIRYEELNSVWDMVVGLDTCDDMIDICEVMENFRRYEFRGE